MSTDAINKMDFSVRQSKPGSWFVTFDIPKWIRGPEPPKKRRNAAIAYYITESRMLGWNGKITWFKSAEVARQAANDFINGKDGWVLIRPPPKPPIPVDDQGYPISKYPETPIAQQRRLESEARSKARSETDKAHRAECDQQIAELRAAIQKEERQ